MYSPLACKQNPIVHQNVLITTDTTKKYIKWERRTSLDTHVARCSMDIKFFKKKERKETTNERELLFLFIGKWSELQSLRIFILLWWKRSFTVPSALISRRVRHPCTACNTIMRLECCRGRCGAAAHWRYLRRRISTVLGWFSGVQVRASTNSIDLIASRVDNLCECSLCLAVHIHTVPSHKFCNTVFWLSLI